MMRLVALLLVTQLIPFIRPGAPGVQSVVNPSITFTSPVADSTFETSVVAQVLGGTCAAGSSALDRATITVSGATTVAETNATGTTSWAIAVEFSVGTSVATAKCYDVSGRVATVQKTIIVTSPDGGDPVVEIVHDGGSGVGANYSVNATTQTVAVECTDDVGCVDLNWFRAEASSVLADGDECAAVGGSAYQCTVNLSPSATNRNFANLFVMTGIDAAGNEHTDTITITRLVTLTITSGLLPSASQDTAYIRQLAETGGTGLSQSWDNGSGATALDAFEAACTGGDISTTGVITGPFTTIGDGECNPTVRLTDSEGSVSKQLRIPVVVGSAEAPHDYFIDLSDDAKSTWNGVHHAWSLRTQSDIDDSDSQSATSTKFQYLYPDGDPADCSGGVCDDDLVDPQDAAKFLIPVNPCVPTTLTARPITESSAADPAVLTWTGGGITNTHVEKNKVFNVDISGHSLAALNDSTTLTVTIDSATGTGAERINTGRLNTSTGSVGTGGSVFVTVCNCTSPDQLKCGGSDGVPTLEQLRFLVHADSKAANSYLIVHDVFYDISWKLYSNILKLWGFVISSNSTSKTGGSVTNFTQQIPTSSDDPEGEGNGAGTGGSVGNMHHEQFGLKLRPPGMINAEPMEPYGQGAAVPGFKTPKSGRYHPQYGTWTRFIHLFEMDVPFSDAKFADWRTLAGSSATASITSCTGADPVVCTFTGSAWEFQGANAPTTTRRLTITNHAGLNGVHEATVISETSFSVPNPGGYAGASGGDVAMHWIAESLWVCDETRDCTRILFRVPWDPNQPYLSVYSLSFNTSAKSGSRLFPLYGYLRNVVMLKDPVLDLTGVCDNADDRGFCTIDADNNPDLLKRPVR